ncbi:Dot/Icm type IV secretion system effector CoxFIC1 [Yinghuangia aomiensis]|uniref:Dot/Icm type IV secretion system effector CoxFIC1 n=1 Tax=Yinghuangia aomiensis TaxID=676205 RepID=A0ABP9IGD8_9ACTN
MPPITRTEARIYATPPLDTGDQRVLTEVEELRERLSLRLRPGRPWSGQLRRNMTARAIAGSNAIEGYPMRVSEVEALLVGEQPMGTPEPTRIEVDGYRRALSWIQALSDADGFAYEAGLLNSLHWMVQGHHAHKRPGRWRNRAVYVLSAGHPPVTEYTAPDPGRIPELMALLIDWLNAGDLDQPVHVRASMAHLNLVNIHPWCDGNGRLSRALSALLFARDGVLPAEYSSIEEWLGYRENTWDYYRVLKRVGGATWSPENDTHPWIKFCLRAHHLQAQSAERRFDLYARIWEQLSEATSRLGLDERVVYALLPAALSGKVRRAVYQHDADLTEQTAQRDLKELVRLGWLRADGRTRARQYVPGESMAPVVAEVLKLMPPYREPYDD